MSDYEYSEGERVLIERQRYIAQWLLDNREQLEELYAKEGITTEQQTALAECMDINDPGAYISMPDGKRIAIDAAMAKLEHTDAA